LTEDNKHSKMTLMSFQEAMAYAATPQAEPRIGSEENVLALFKDIMKENKNNRPGDGGKMSPFMIILGGS
jgi:hypothetical protein